MMTKEEIQDLRKIYSKFKNQDTLSSNEIERFIELVEKLKEKRPDHVGTWILGAISSFLRGLEYENTTAK